jgi:hypothetical protein
MLDTNSAISISTQHYFQAKMNAYLAIQIFSIFAFILSCSCRVTPGSKPRPRPRLYEMTQQHGRVLKPNAESEDSSKFRGKEMSLRDKLEKQIADVQRDADQLSLATRYVGIGYNLIRGSPEGDFNLGGNDPGIKITHHIFRFTYDENKMASYLGSSMQVPDQVNFQAFSTCASSTEKKAYSGAKSYQEELSVNVEAEGKH